MNVRNFKFMVLLITAPVLAYSRFGPDQWFVFKTDARYVGLGAVLSQVQDDGLIQPTDLCLLLHWQAQKDLWVENFGSRVGCLLFSILLARPSLCCLHGPCYLLVNIIINSPALKTTENGHNFSRNWAWLPNFVYSSCAKVTTRPRPYKKS